LAPGSNPTIESYKQRQICQNWQPYLFVALCDFKQIFFLGIEKTLKSTSTPAF
jgi:hypothetical protein